MNLLDVFYSKAHLSKQTKLRMLVLYILDKILIVIAVSIVVFLLQHYVEQRDYELQSVQERNTRIAEVVNSYSEQVMEMSTDLDEVDRPLSGESLWADYDKAQCAIEALLIQASLNKNAFAPYSAEIQECKQAVDGYCEFIREMLDPNNSRVSSLAEYSSELKKYHKAIQLSCMKLSNHCSDVLYGFE